MLNTIGLVLVLSRIVLPVLSAEDVTLCILWTAGDSSVCVSLPTSSTNDDLVLSELGAIITVCVNLLKKSLNLWCLVNRCVCVSVELQTGLDLTHRARAEAVTNRIVSAPGVMKYRKNWSSPMFVVQELWWNQTEENAWFYDRGMSYYD